jgi:predicted TIM-barrel fold metal-dependent hydrolase
MEADADFLVRQADAAGFHKLFVTELNALFYDMRAGNDALAKQVAMHPDRLIGYVSIPTPRLGTRAVEEVRRCYEQHGFRGIKIYSHPEASIAEPETEALLAAAAELQMPILAHTTPDECDQLMRRVPEARLVMAHMGGHPYAFGDWHRAVAVARKHKNLLLDTASSQIDNGMIEWAVAELGPDRILFGTDMPLLDPHTQLAKVAGAEIDDQAKARILGGNLADLLDLP